MPYFKYRAIELNGAKSSGVIEAYDEINAISSLEGRGLKVYELFIVNKENQKNDHLVFFGNLKIEKSKVKSEEILLCMQEMSTLLNAGIPLADAMLNISQGHASRATGPMLAKTYKGLRSGKSFAASIGESNLELPEYVIELIRAGEETGKLGPALQSVVEQMEVDANFQRETKNALTYPLVLILSGLVATMVVFVFVVPKFANILTNPKADIPFFSRWVLQSGLWVVENKILVFVFFVAIIFAFWRIFSEKKMRLKMWDFASSMPFARLWIKNVELARWASMFSVLLQNHVPLLDALAHSKNSLTAYSWRSKAELMAKEVKSGQSLTLAMEKNHFLDSIGLNLVRVGERSGKLSQTCASLAKMHRMHAQQTMKKFLVLLEPLTILLISIFLGGIMISVMVAITSLTNVI